MIKYSGLQYDNIQFINHKAFRKAITSRIAYKSKMDNEILLKGILS